MTIFDSFDTHPWLGRTYRKLTGADRRLAYDFMAQNQALSKGDFELKVNRMFVDKDSKPKNWTLIIELLTCANSAFRS